VVSAVRPCRDDERNTIVEIVDAATRAYRGGIPADRWREPYMPGHELDAEIAAGLQFWGYETRVQWSASWASSRFAKSI
jgi:hypothetical protein